MADPDTKPTPQPGQPTPSQPKPGTPDNGTPGGGPGGPTQSPQSGYAGQELAVAKGRTNWPDDPDRYLASNLQSAAGHRPPTLAVDPYAPVYVPGDPNSLVPGEVDSQGREVNPPPAPLPEAGDDYYYPRPEPALDDIPRDSRQARTQESLELEQAQFDALRTVTTRDPDAGKGDLKADREPGSLSVGNTKGATQYRPKPATGHRRASA